MAKVSARRMVGWLLRANRTLTQVDRRLRLGKEFARLFRAGGEPVLAASHITRWEQGVIAVGSSTIRRYERMLDLDPESLVTICDAVDRLEPNPYQGIESRTSDDHVQRLKELLDLALSGDPITGLQWASLAEIIRSTPGLFLYPTEKWTALTSRLLEELVVADHREWLLRQEAMSKLLEHPYAAPHAVQSCIDLVGDRNSAAVLEPMSLLDVSATAKANEYVLSQLIQSSDESVLYAAAVVARQKLLRGHFEAAQVRRLAAAAAERARNGGPGNVLNLLQSLAGSARRPQSLRTPSAETVQDISSRTALHVHGAIAAEREDPLLAEMINEALFGPESDRRMIAAMCLAATPYQVHVGVALVAEIQAGLASREEGLALTALRTLTTLAVDVHRPIILQILTKPGFSTRVREAAAWALPHCRGRYSEATWRELLTKYGESWRREPSAHLARMLHALAYGAGTDDHRSLAGEIRNDPSLPGEARRVAAWLWRTRRGETVGSP